LHTQDAGPERTIAVPIMLTSEDVDDAFDDEAFMEERFSDVQRLLLGHGPALGRHALPADRGTARFRPFRPLLRRPSRIPRGPVRRVRGTAARR
jgi:hypothetical protein